MILSAVVTTKSFDGDSTPHLQRKEAKLLGVVVRSLSDQIIQYRARHNLNQQEFAELCSLTKQTIGAIESGRHGITKLTRAKILRVIEGDFPTYELKESEE